MWIYGSGFPKSHNHFGLEGYGTALKPAYEPIIMAMKPCDGTFKENAEKWGQGGINIDGCRIEAVDQNKLAKNWNRETISDMRGGNFKESKAGMMACYKNAPKGRWPANVLFDEEAAKILDEQSGISKSSGHIRHNTYPGSEGFLKLNPMNLKGIQDFGGASRFFYCAKASSSERSELNNHPTVKPLKLMEYLIKLVMPPKDGLLLDPFAGSGTPILAAQRLGFNAIGIEKSSDYCAIAEQRITNDRSMMIERDDQQIMLNF
jgi:site-specific DNA-methyltransferase (adenine-specific)